MNRRAVLLMAVLLVLLAAGYLLLREEAPPEEVPAAARMWSVDWAEIERIQIGIPGDGLVQSWVKHSDDYWYFEEPEGAPVDMDRWGGGIPLILSGPRADRVVSRSPSSAELSRYGLVSPNLEITLELRGGDTIRVAVGDRTPGEDGYYLRRLGSPVVYIVDHSWVEVLEGLVRNPPYAERSPESVRDT